MVDRKKKNQRIIVLSDSESSSSDEEPLISLLRTTVKKVEPDEESDSPNEEGVFEVENIVDKRLIGNTNRVGLIVLCLLQIQNFLKACYCRCRLNI